MAGRAGALSGGRTGYYEADEPEVGMGARPSDAYIWWIRGGVRYVVYEYAGSRADVVWMANSVVPVLAGKRQAAGVPNAAFRGVLAKVLHDSDVPVILPTYPPDWPGGYYISLGNDKRDGWPIFFLSRLDGGPVDDAADVGFFDAEKITAHMEREPRGVPVPLTRGRTGHYRLIVTPRNQFDQGEMWWNQGGVRYIIQ